MAYNQQPNFWDFVNSFDPNHQATGEGVDHHQANPFFPFGFPFGGPAHNRGGRRHGPGHHGPGASAWGDNEEWNSFFEGGRRTRRDAPPQQRDESETMRAESDAPDPAEVTPEDSDEAPPRHRGPPHGHRGPPHGHRGPHSRRGRCGGRGGFRRHGHPHHHAGPPPYAGFDFASMINGLNDHPFFQSLRDQINPNATNTHSTTNDENDIDAFTPPLDLFSTPSSYTLHLAIPGAKKEDVGVNWNPETSTLHIAGVIHRIGDEEFLKTLQGKGERTVGMFERKVELKGDEVDAGGIGAKLEDGVLVVTAPKVEKGWTEIHKVDIE